MPTAKNKPDKGASTTILHTGYTLNPDDGAITPPIHLSTTFKFGNNGGHYDETVPLKEWQENKAFKFNNGFEHYDYSRTANPTRILLEEVIAKLDGNDFGLVYSSGSAALANIVALLKPNETILFSADAYGGTYRYIVKAAAVQGIQYKIVDLTDQFATDRVLKAGGIKIIWIETPSNPLLKVADISKLSQLAKKYGALFVVDNTFATPILQQPALLGADIVAQAMSKYINGHADVIGGSLTTSNKGLYTKLKFLQNATGAILSPFDSWLTLRGLRTLELRVDRQTDTAEKIANLLNGHKKVKNVYYPRLFTGEQRDIVNKQMKRPGAMISIELHDQYDAKKFLAALKYFPLAESLGGVESLIDHPASMTHSAIPKEERQKIGLSDNLFRISVGIENAADLVADLQNALDQL
jgi:cysteine-S-conjugate beta-lyase